MSNSTSVVLEFKLVDNFHKIVNKDGTFSISDMVANNSKNRFEFVPVSNCADTWSANIKSDYTLDKSKAVPIKKISYSDSGDITTQELDCPVVELIAEEVGYGGLVVSIGSTTPTLSIGSEVQDLKGVFLCNEYTGAVISYCILPQPAKIMNYLTLPSEGFVVEILPTYAIPTQ
jgi:hypothetical protein